MGKPEYVSLHNHTDYSVLDGYSKPAEYISRAAEMGHRGIGISDHGNLHGMYSFINNSRAAGLSPVPGCEFYVAPENPEGARHLGAIFYGPNGRKAAGNDVSGNGAYLHLTVWAYNSQGLHNLFVLSSLSSKPEHYYMKPRIDFKMLEEYNEGLVVSTGCPSSEISTRLLLGQTDKAYEYAGRLKDIFGDRLFVEIMDHNMDIDLERKLLPQQLLLSKKLDIPLLATNDCHYAHEHEALHHEEMLCIQSSSVMSEASYDDGGSRFKFNGNEYYLKTAEQMDKLFPHRDFPNALANTLAITEMSSDISVDFDPTLKPKPILPEGFDDEVAYYKHLINEGYKERYGNASPEVKKEALARNKKEFEVIHSSDFIGYMLVVSEYLRWTRENYSVRDANDEIVALSIGVGRGSVGGSIHAFELGISEIDPVKHDLIFERFLSAGRGATYLVQYDDGTQEEVIVSDTRQVVVDSEGDQPSIEPRYIHQLAVGDVITVPGNDGDVDGEAATLEA